MCVHSTYFLLELLDETGSHFVERDPCDLTPNLAALADRLITFRTEGTADDRAVLADEMARP